MCKTERHRQKEREPNCYKQRNVNTADVTKENAYTIRGGYSVMFVLAPLLKRTQFYKERSCTPRCL